MTKPAVVAALALVVAGCGGKTDDAKNAASAIAAVTSGAAQAGLQNAEKFQQARVAKGDTVAMAYTDLQKFLPASFDGYTAEAPSGSSQSMGGFSMAQAEQTWKGPAKADGSTPEIQVTLVDFSGTQQAYGMMAAPMLSGFKQEDAHRRAGSVKVGLADTGAWEDFNKDNSDAKITMVTRYRYMVTVEARNQGEDRSKMVLDLAESIAKKFDGK